MTNEEIYNSYFKTLEDIDKGNQVMPNTSDKIYANKESARVHTRESSAGIDHELSYYNKADGNISNIEELAGIIKKLCNAAWGNDWGELSLDLKTGEDSSNIILPQILMDINTRDVSDDVPGALKPVLMDVQKEKDENGNDTGDAFLMYRQWFDANIEFDIYGKSASECRQLSDKFQTLMMVYTGYLKRKGVSEIFFLREIAPRSSLNFSENKPMRCILYYVRFESITPVRVNTINAINAKIGANQITSTKVKTLVDDSVQRQQPVELDFFNGDNGITYE